MTGRGLLTMYHGMLVARFGRTAVDAVLNPEPVEPERAESQLDRAARHLAIVQMGGEVASAAG